MSDAFLVSLFEHKAWANREMFAALRAVPEGGARAEVAVMLLTLDHLSRTDQLFKARILGEPEPFDAVVARKVPKLDELAATVAATDAWYINYARKASRQDLEEIVEFVFVSDGDKGRMSRQDMLAHVLTHGQSHRGAVGKMMETLAIPGASDMFTTFVRTRDM